MKSILITTIHRGVWFAQVDPEMDLTSKTLTDLQNTKMAIRWGTERGLQQLCKTGPTLQSLISDASDIYVLHDVTGVFRVSEKATEEWLKY